MELIYFFWTNPWLGDSCACRFPRWFELSENRWVTTAGMFSLRWGKKGERGRPKA